MLPRPAPQFTGTPSLVATHGRLWSPHVAGFHCWAVAVIFPAIHRGTTPPRTCRLKDSPHYSVHGLGVRPPALSPFRRECSFWSSRHRSHVASDEYRPTLK